ncbi:hypothetical protein [uncultured Tateyamaria sp.]|uniref:hypothetical protein n=1 Tax=uncultured Tateyamaria sp. TaxID=455651 RepID=UPI0026031453|nr:hypothetical protein [uncultured Tateyamaria sp.]
MAKERPVNRARLQDLLWSDRGLKQGRDSLRKALSELRGCFKDIDLNPVQSHGGPVRLLLDKIEVDLFEDTSDQGLYRPEFLEGIDVIDPEFNTWLTGVRAKLYSEDRTKKRAVPAQVAASKSEPARLGSLLEVGVLPIISDHRGLGTAMCDMFADKLGELFLECAIIQPYDYRSQSASQVEGMGPDVVLSIRHNQVGNGHFISINFQATGDRATVFSCIFQIDEADFSLPWVMRKCAEIFDQFCEKLVRFEGFSEPRHLAAKRLFFAIDRIFRLSNFDLDQAGNLLEEACKHTSASTVYAWNAFLTAFRLEKSGAGSHQALMEQAESYARKALERDPHNALTVALVGHVYGFVLRDKNRAAELLSNFADQAQYQPMLADTIAMHCYYMGDFKTARSFAGQAAQLGRFNPFRYSFTTSLAMTSLMCGDLRPAVQYCNAALAQHPVSGGTLYEPTLRTLAAAAGHAGQKNVGRIAYRNLANQTGTSPLENINEAAFPNRETLSFVKSGMEKLNV